MKNLAKRVIFLILFGIFTQSTSAQTTKTVGSGGNYTTLKAAFDAINSGGITGALVLQVISNTTETASASLNASGSGSASYTSINIYPTASNVSISGNIAGNLINLNGADYVTFNGSLNGANGGKELTIENTSTSTSATAIKFTNNATYDVVTYCYVKGSNPSTTTYTDGVITFSSGTNSNNQITYCNVGPSGSNKPSRCIISGAGTNNNNTVNQCNIFDFVGGTGTHSGIYLYWGTTSTWTITNNSFYQTSSVSVASAANISPIYVRSGDGYTITGNYIGGTSSNCGGSAMTYSGVIDAFCGIDLQSSVGKTNITTINGNYIQNINFSSSSVTGSSNSCSPRFSGINMQNGKVDITNNIIGKTDANNNITISVTGSFSLIYLINTGYSNNVNVDNCDNNIVGGITITGTQNYDVIGINLDSPGTLTSLDNNVFGSTTSANSINMSGTIRDFIGIYSYTSSATTPTFSNNIVQNISRTGSLSSGTYGIFISSNVNTTLSNSTVKNVSSTSAGGDIYGIYFTYLNQGVSNNTIDNLSGPGNIYGIYTYAQNPTIEKNFIKNLKTSSTTSDVCGIYSQNSTNGGTIKNNIVMLGYDNTGASLSNLYFKGIYVYYGASVLYNTVYIGGTGTSGTRSTYAFYNASNGYTRDFRNNLFINARTNSGGSGSHYAIYLPGTTSLTCNNNDYYVSGSGSVLGYLSGDKSTLATWKTATGQDALSLNTWPSFGNAGGTIATDYLPFNGTLVAATGTGVTTDYLGTTRNVTSPAMGAFEYRFPVQVSSTSGLTGLTNYATLKLAFDAINAGAHNGIITINIVGSTTETATATLNASGSGSANYTSVSIFPTGTGNTISGNIAGPIIYLNGADNVVIDGRVNATGSTKDLTITNTNTGSSSSTIKFGSSAENNIVKYCTIKGSETNSASGIILFSTSSSGNGCDNNLIDNNNITSDAAGRPYNAIYTLGTSGHDNSGITISNNNIYDFFRSNNYSNGIYIGSNSSGWTISGNSFYETTTITPTGANAYYVINISTSVNHLISGNYIGGSTSLCGGSAWTMNSSFAHNFYTIYVNGGTSTPVTVQNNVIQNINYTSTNNNPWDGIYLASGNINVTGNTIGATTGTGSIIITTPNAAATATISGGVVTAINLIGGGSGFTTAPTISFSQSGSTTSAVATAVISGGVVTGFTITNGGTGYTAAPNVLFNGTNSYSTSHGIRHLSAGAVTISNNNIGSITAIGTNSYSHCFESIVISGVASTITLTNNLIGSLTTANSIQTSSTATSSLIKQDLRGIYINSSVSFSTISGNTISNLANSYLGNSISRLDGIYTTGGSNTIQNNIINNLSADGASVLVKGIQQGGTSSGTIQSITGNIIYNLYNTNASGNVTVSGIQYSGSTSTSNNVSQNFVYSLSVVSTNTNSEIDGIVIGGGVVTCANNIINLGGGISKGYNIYGIFDNNSGIASNFSNIYFNSIYIAGAVSSGATSSTAALWNSNNGSTRNYKNNILMNARSGGSSGAHYAIRSAGTSGLTINYNDYFVSGSGILGNISGADKSTLALWQTATGQDVNSLNINPGFSVAGGTLALNYYASSVLPGVSGTGITIDYDGLTRGIIPHMGALETNNFVWQGGISSNFGTAGNWTSGVVPPNGADISFAVSPNNNCVLDQNRSLEDITNAQSTYKFITNGKKLTLTGMLYFSNGAQIDATAASSEIVFGGITAQNIPAGSFLSNTIDSLKINNINGLTLNGDLTIVNGIALNAGNFAIGPNTLTFNGIVTAMSGSVTGGSSTNMIIGGSGGSISMPNFTLNNLTINRASGVNLYGDLNLVGTLSLTSGTLTVGPNTLTISGNSPTRTTGNVDVSNSSANLVFANTSAIVIPASLFNGNINNLTINGAGGITVGDDLVLNGILNLANVNPSGTKGLLDMWNGSAMKTITMNSNATTIGLGDVTGIVKRTSFVSNVCYSFGNPFTCMTFSASGALPTEINIKINLGTAPAWKTNSILRYYDIKRDGGTSSNLVTLSLHYLDSELNSNPESNLVTWDYHSGTSILEEHGKATNSATDNWIMISNRAVTYFDATYDTHLWTISNSITPDFTWQGTASSDWTDANNWSGNDVPISTSDVTIPDASTTLNDPILPASTLIKTLTLSNGAILNGGTSTSLTISGGSGAWYNNGGVFVPGTSTVVFTHVNATISGINNFYNLTINPGAALTTQTSSVTKIAGTMTNNGLWHTVVFGQTTVEYNGADQTIVVPNPATNRYCNLVLSGSGIKTLPSSAMTITCNLKISGTASVLGKANININGNLNIESSAAFETGTFNHSISGNLINDGTLIATLGSTITMCGSNSAQLIEGSSSLITLHNLNVNNSFSSGGVSIAAPTTITNTLTLTSKPVYTYLDRPFTLAAGSSVSPIGGSVSSFVDGPLTKEGTTSFIFPLGNGSRWARLGIGTPTASTTFRAQYFASVDTNTSYMSQTTLPVLENVSTQEYWQLDRIVGTGDATVTLYWEDAAWSGIGDCPNLRIAHRNTVDSTWENNNNAVTTTGTCSGATSGSITTDIAVTSFSPFTFGSLSASTNTLPVELINLETKCLDNHTKLLWQTVSETNNAFFEIEKTENNKDWQSIGKVDGTGNSNQVINYSFIDEKTNTHTNYYRLKQVDFDGKQEYSSVISSNCNDIQEIEISLSSNPTRDFVKINLSNNISKWSYQLFSANGRLIKENKIESVETIIDLRNYSSATYYLKVIDEMQEVKVFKVIKY